MVQSKEMQQESKLPKLSGVQFDPDSSIVNVFRGSSSFPVQLLNMPGRNGLDFSLSLFYQSDLALPRVSQWSLDESRDIAGVGWSLPYEHILISSKSNGTLEDNQYFWVMNGQPTPLLPIQRAWEKGVLDSSYQADLVNPTVSPNLQLGFAAQQISVSTNSAIFSLGTTTESWRIEDPDNEKAYILTLQADGTILIETGGISFELYNYQYWRISYYPLYESWEIVKNDGNTYTFGGSGEQIDTGIDPNTQQYGVKWGNWIGPSSQTAGQQRYTKAWNLAKVQNSLGNYYIVNYLVENQCVGNETGLEYTKNCVVSKVKNDLGWSVEYKYENSVYDNSSLEAPKEYLDPHTDSSVVPGTPNAYQSSYLTKYLSELVVRNISGEVQTYVRLNYINFGTEEVPNYLWNSNSAPGVDASVQEKLAYGSTYDRYLGSITQYAGESYGYPEDILDRYGSPGVSFNYNFEDSAKPLGLLAEIINPSGGKTSLEYEKKEVGTPSQDSRSLTVNNPFGLEKPGTVRTWSGQDYVVCCWNDTSSNRLLVNVYTWMGWWHPSFSDWMSFDESFDIDRLQVIPSANTFLLVLSPYNINQKTHVYKFNRIKLQNGDWTCSNELSPEVYKGNQISVVSGDDFFVIKNDEVIDSYTWNPLLQSWSNTLQINIPNGITYYTAATENYYVLFKYNNLTQAGEFNYHGKDIFGNWNIIKTLEVNLPIPHFNGFSFFQLSPSSSFVALSVVTGYVPAGSNFKAFDYELSILSWDVDYNLQFTPMEGIQNSSNGAFKNIPSSVLNGYPGIYPVVVNNSAIGTGPNYIYYNGNTWTCESLGVDYDGFSDLSHQYYWYAYDEQGVIKTENTDSGILSKVGNIDPSNPGAGWLSQTLLDDPGHFIDRYDKAYPTNGGQFISIGDQVYCKPLGTGEWGSLSGQDFLNIMQGLNAGETIDTTTFVNSGSYVVFQILDENENPKDVGIVYFKNGTFVVDDNNALVMDRFVNQKVFEFFNTDHRYKSKVNGKIAQTAGGVITYPATASSLDETPSITLNRYSAEDFKGIISGWVVKSITYDSGYDQSHMCYEYDQTRAAADGFKGNILRFYRVGEYKGCLTPPDPGTAPNGFTVSYFYNGLPVDELGGAINAYSLLDGQLQSKEEYLTSNGADQLLTKMSMNFDVKDEIAINPDETVIQPVYGGIVQVSSIETEKEGITTTAHTSYSLSSGNVIESNSSYYDSTGQQTFVKDVVTHAYKVDEYKGLWYQNNLALSAQNSKYVGHIINPTTLASSQVQTYKLWETSPDPTVPAKWGTWKTYIAENDSPNLFIWWSGPDEPDSSVDGWIKSNDVISRNEQGAVITYKDIEGIPTTSLYNNSGSDIDTFTLATFANAALEDGISYTSFESYQGNPWSQTGTGAITFNDAFMGKQCYQLSALQGADSTISQDVTINNADQYYCFNLWYKTPAMDDPTNTITLSITESTATSPQNEVLPLTNGEWKPFQWSVNLANLWSSVPAGPLTLTLSVNFTTSNTSDQTLRLDQIVFTPTLSPFAGTVFDIDKLRPLGNISADGMSGKVLYNLFNAQYIAIGPYNQTTELGSHYSVRQARDYNPSAAFPQSNPGLSISVAGRDQGFYDLLMSSESLDNYSALEGSINNWSVVNNMLQIDSTSSSQLLQVQNYSTKNISVYMVNTPTFTVGEANPQLPIRLGITDTAPQTNRFYVQWDGGNTNQWQLIKWNGSTESILTTNSNENWQPAWVLTVVDDRLFFTANGILIFNYQDADLLSDHSPIFGVDSTTNQGQITFQSLTALGDIQMGLSYNDGFERPLQSLAVESSNSVIVTPAAYDSLGKSSVSFLPSRVTSTSPGVTNPFDFDLGFIDNGDRIFGGSIWDGNPVSGNITNYHSDGYPFSRVVNEASPLERPIQEGGAGIDFAITSAGNTHITTYDYGTNTTDPGFLYALPADQYFTTTVTDSDGNQAVQYSATNGQVVGVIKNDSTGSNPIKSSQVYDVYGQVIGSIPPNYYQNNPSAQTNSFDSSSSPVPAIASSYEYDFWGRQIRSTYPDSGTQKFIYDNVGRPRFTQDANGAASDDYFNYIKYDVLGRNIEEGVYTGTSVWDEATLKVEANNPAYPSTNTTVRGDALYDIDNTTGDNTTNLTSIGRPWKTTSFNSNTAGTDTANITDTLVYRTTGEVLTKTQQATYNGVADTAYIMTYDYTVNGRLKNMTDNITSAVTTYNVNMLGQTKEIVATASTKTVKAEYTHNQNGDVENINLLKPDGSSLTTRSYTYLENNWIAGMSDSYVDQDLKYTEGSCASATSGYYNGALAHNEVTYPGATTPPPSDYCYSVDHLNRVITANNNGGNSHSWTFDDNSNFIDYTIGSTTRNYTTATDKNQLVSITNDPSFIRYYSYDADGSVIQTTDGTNTLMDVVYTNWNNKARSISKPQDDIESVFDYGSNDMRFRKRVYDTSGTTTLSKTVTSSGALEIDVDHNTSTTQTKRFMGTNGVGLIYRQDNNTFYWKLPDHLGSIRMIIDEVGNTQYLYNYDVYGVPTTVPIGTPTLICNNLYTGQYYDSELELYNYHARFYDPFVARFIQTDPANQYYNPYSYVGGMPNMTTDPSGMWSGQAGAALGLGILAVLASIVATIATAGTSSPILVGTIVGFAAGAGATSISYSATNQNNNVYESGGFWGELGIGAVFGAIGGAIGSGIGAAGWSAGKTFAADVAISAALGAVDGYVGNGVSSGEWSGSGAGVATGIGAGAEALTAGVLGFLGRGLSKRNGDIVKNGGETPVGVGFNSKGHKFSHSLMRINETEAGFEQTVSDLGDAPMYSIRETLLSNQLVQRLTGKTPQSLTYFEVKEGYDPIRAREAVVNVKMDDAAKGLTLANQRIRDTAEDGQSMGHYSLLTNSCSSNVVDVLQKIGFRVPLYAARIPFALRLWFGILSDTQNKRPLYHSIKPLFKKRVS